MGCGPCSVAYMWCTMLHNDIHYAYIQQLCTIGNGEVADSNLQYIYGLCQQLTHFGILWGGVKFNVEEVVGSFGTFEDHWMGEL